jgi:farnesyl-diphosphate farnesyltransferase
VDETVVEAWTIPFLLAVGTLRELTERPEDALSPAGVKLSREDVLAIVTTVRGEDRPPVSSLERAVWRDELG